MIYRRCCVALFALLALFAAGCMLVDDDRVQKDDQDRIPWNERQDWENSTIGVPQ